ncbi:hypothetical protein C3L33_11959, partial [Rhododendron williamsianum]
MAPKTKRPHMCVYGFGSHPTTHEYEVIRIQYEIIEIGEYELKLPPKVEIYTQGTRSWRGISSAVPSYRIVNYMWCQAFVDGAVHWVAYETCVGGGVRNLIMLFNMASETFSVMKVVSESQRDCEKQYNDTPRKKIVFDIRIQELHLRSDVGSKRNWVTWVEGRVAVDVEEEECLTSIMLIQDMLISEQYILLNDDDKFGDEYSELELPSKLHFGYCGVVGSCNGLLCLSDKWLCRSYDYNDQPQIIIWNPSTRKSVTLPKAPKPQYCFNISVYGFGAHPTTQEYKAFLNGVVHWVASDPCKEGGLPNSIMLFDMASESFSEIMLPPTLAADQNRKSLSIHLPKTEGDGVEREAVVKIVSESKEGLKNNMRDFSVAYYEDFEWKVEYLPASKSLQLGSIFPCEHIPQRKKNVFDSIRMQEFGDCLNAKHPRLVRI